MVDLRVNLGGVELKNPLVVASADIGRNLNQIKEAEGYGAGGFIIKGCIPMSGATGLTTKMRYRVSLKRGEIIANSGALRLSLDQAKDLLSAAAKEVKIPVGGNIFAFVPTNEEMERVVCAAREMAKSGASFVELDTTGNLPVHFGQTKSEESEESSKSEEGLSEEALKYPDWVNELIKETKKVVDIPVMAKVAPENLNVPALLVAMEDAKADVIDLINVFVSGPKEIDIYNRRMTKVQSANKAGGPILTGAPLKLVSQGYIIRAAKTINTPILGCGGIMKWVDVVETIMCGATATAACTLFMIRGFETLKDMEWNLRKFMEEQGYSHIEEFRGVLVDQMEMTHSNLKVCDVVAKVDKEKCTGCGLCLKPAHCGWQRRAIHMEDEVAIIDEEQCLGCETCASLCPTNAIEMVERGS